MEKPAFDDFVDTYINKSRYSYYYLADWGNINDAFGNNIECYIAGYWDEMSQHIYELADFRNIEELPEYIASDDSSLLLLMKLAVYFLKLPVPDFQIKSHQAVLGIFERNIDKNETINMLNYLLDLDGLEANKTLLLLDYLCEKHINFVEKYKDKLLLLATNDDISIRLQSIKILSKLGIETPNIGYKPLPPFYYFSFDDTYDFGNKEVSPHEVLPDAISTQDFLRILENDISVLSEITGVDYNTIAMRIIMTVKRLEPENMWDKNAEKKLGEWLENINQIRIYHRPRPQIVKRALNIVLGELLDANMIPDNVTLLVFSSIAKRVNKYLSLVSPASIQVFLQNNPFVLEWRKDMHKNSKEWIENINFDMHSLFSYYEDKMILGAYTIFSYLDWGKPTEIDISCVCFEDIAEHITETSDLLMEINTLRFYSSDIYPRPYKDMPKSLTVYCSEIGIDHCGVSWIAFNPEIALDLSWKFDNSEGLFKWIDSEGKTMVECLYFKDGSLALQPPRSDLFCSKGWLVLASEEAINQIRKMFHSLYKIEYTKRSFVEEKNECAKSLCRKNDILI